MWVIPYDKLPAYAQLNFVLFVYQKTKNCMLFTLPKEKKKGKKGKNSVVIYRNGKMLIVYPV